jgi:hypothetical protein
MSQLDGLNASITIPLGAGTVSAGTSISLIMSIPGTLYGGGITIKKIWYCANKAVAAGSAPSLAILGLTSAGGTAATYSTNGSAALTAGTPIAGTIDTAWVPGTVSFLGLKYGHENLAASSTQLTCNIVYAIGRGSA